MATSKKRINISVPADIDSIITRLAKRDSVPQATKAAHLLRLALEIEEDHVLDEIASRRDVRGTKFVLHSKVWR